MNKTGTNGMPRRSFITTMALGGVGASLAAAGRRTGTGRWRAHARRCGDSPLSSSG